MSVDTVRADHLSVYGYSRETSPFVQSLAREGVLFEQAYATSSWTVPSIVSMLSGTYPVRHGIVHGVVSKKGVYKQRVVPKDLPNLAARLKSQGYRTFGVTANPHLTRSQGFARGFDRYECVRYGEVSRVAGVVRSILEKLPADAPWFLWVHLFDPHARYQRREPWFSQMWSGKERFEELDGTGPPGNISDEERLDYVRTLYDSEIRHTDEYFRKLYDSLPDAEKALVVYTADHGEEFKDHGGVSHGKTLYQEQVRIPLVLRLPGSEDDGRVARGVVSLVDLVPTILDATGTDAPPDLAGRSLLPMAYGNPLNRRPAFLDLQRGPNHVRGVVLGRWKYTRRVKPKQGQSLFDLKSDPGERNDRRSSETDRVRRLRRLVKAHRRQRGRERTPDVRAVPEKTVERLESLGYVQ